MVDGSGADIEAAGLVNTLQGHVDGIRNLIHCGICIRPLYEPFTLACVLDIMVFRGKSKRTCPDCRAPVKTQPAPAYLVRAIVQLFTSRAELLDKGETTAEHTKNQREEAERLEKDKANLHPSTGGLFGGLFKPKIAQPRPLMDPEDGVVRCPNCQWELSESDECEGCGYVYQAESEDTDYSDSDFSDTDLSSLTRRVEGHDRDFEDMEPQAGMLWGVPAGSRALQDFLGYPSQSFDFYPPMGFPSGDYDEEEEEDDDDYDDMDSFIDDEQEDGEPESQSDHSTVVGGARRNRTHPTFAPAYVDTDDSDDEVEEIDGHHSDSDAESSSSAESNSTAPHGTRSSPMESSGPEVPDNSSFLVPGYRYARSTVSPVSGDDSESMDSSSPPRPMGRLRDTGSNARNAITIDDSEEDDQPIAPVRRRPQRRYARYSPY
ncbi:hypothetical protein NUU61_002825 [Penicillium alfredii]|uniref:RING-type domain-containing protein n=1 Tax=Penicillium alfredii TaxID=1506179 RepID=A0A9W9KHB0_9EURO|nr:uncharacterized protein NUU61_002825 [Penicillium alfredii]KAJ5105478.1 hypothetical protein NUU61_002825 [Penicillium alfredii]